MLHDTSLLVRAATAKPGATPGERVVRLAPSGAWPFVGTHTRMLGVRRVDGATLGAARIEAGGVVVARSCGVDAGTIATRYLPRALHGAVPPGVLWLPLCDPMPKSADAPRFGAGERDLCGSGASVVVTTACGGDGGGGGDGNTGGDGNAPGTDAGVHTHMDVHLLWIERVVPPPVEVAEYDSDCCPCCRC